MIKIEDYEILMKHMSTLKETSIDKHDNGSVCYMTNSPLRAVNFDDVKGEYIKYLKLEKDAPKSIDALYIKSEEKAIFIEFKNGCINRNKAFDIRKKIYDSLLIFGDITKKGICDTRKHMDFILVYNKQKNCNTDEDPETKIQESESKDIIAKKFAEWGKTEHIKFGLEIFKSYCFKEVHTYNEEEFEDFLKNNTENSN